MWERFNYFETYQNILSLDQCERVIDYAKAQPPIDGKLGVTRIADIFWLAPSNETNWLFSAVWNVIQRYNEGFGYKLVEQIGALQISRYGPGQQYDWHMDLGPGPMSHRKISLSIELQSAQAGGGFEVFYGTPYRVPLNPGDAVIFPSFIMHKAVEVVAGERWSLVAWLLGHNTLD